MKNLPKDVACNRRVALLPDIIAQPLFKASTIKKKRKKRLERMRRRIAINPSPVNSRHFHESVTQNGKSNLAGIDPRRRPLHAHHLDSASTFSYAHLGQGRQVSD